MFHQPHSIEEALEIRAEMGAEVTPVGGGTDLVVALNRRTSGPKHLLDLTHIEGYSDVGARDGGWFAAAGATFSRLGRLPVRALAEAAMSVGGPAIRNRGTIAGNLGTASPAGDGCVALLAVGAEIEVRHASRGARLIPIDEFFLDYAKTALLADELITGVLFAGDEATAWYKIGKRGATNISVVCCAIGLAPSLLDGEAGTDRTVRIAFGSVGPTVLRAKKAEAIIAAGGLSNEAIEAAAASAMAEVSPIDDHRASAAYRRAMCGVLVRRLLGNVETSKCRDVETSEARNFGMAGLAPPLTGGGAVTEGGIAGRLLLKCAVNGDPVEVEIEQDDSLLTVLRDRLYLTGSKGACLEGECGSCTVVVDGRAVNSCLMLAAQAQGCSVETIEGLATGDKLHVLQEKFVAGGAVQCGYCTPGLVMAAKALLTTNPNPSEEELMQGMEGNICRCTGYGAIREAVQAARQEWAGSQGPKSCGCTPGREDPMA